MKWAQEVKNEENSNSDEILSESSSKSSSKEGDESSFMSYDSEKVAIENKDEEQIDMYYQHARTKLCMNIK